MKAVYIYDGIIDPELPVERESNGIIRKVKMQIRAFERLGIRMRLWMPRPPKHNGLARKIASRLPFFPMTSVWNIEDDFADCDFVYIRKGSVDRWFLRFLKKLRERNPELTILFEVPTYPYDSELMTPALFPLLIKERIHRVRLRNDVDRIVTFSAHEEIWGIPTVRTQNGIDVERTPIKRNFAAEPGRVHILAVAVFSKWHGLDRLIRGLSDYCRKRGPNDPEVMLQMVGDGPSGNEYRTLSAKLSLGENIVFSGNLFGQELDEAFERADIAVASLGIHRIDLASVSTLKAREYCARGIPFIKAYDDQSFPPSEFPYCLNCPADESPIDITSVVQFFQNLRDVEDGARTAKKMREYASEHLSWESRLSMVVSEATDIRQKRIDGV